MSDKTVTIGLKVTPEQNTRIEKAADNSGCRSRQQWIRDLINDELSGWDTTTESTTTEQTPDDRRDAELYDALLDQIPLKGWTRWSRVKGQLAQQTRYGQDALYGELKSLRRNGFCTIRVLNPTDENPHYEIKVKPPAADPEIWTHRETDERPDIFAIEAGDTDVDVREHHLIAAIDEGDEERIDKFQLADYGLRRVEDEDDDRLVAPIDEPEPTIEDELDRISHGTPNSDVDTHVSRTSREQVIEELREAEELTNDSEAEA